MEEWVPSESDLVDAESDIELVDVDEPAAAEVDVVLVSSSTDSSSYPDIPTFSTSKDSGANLSLTGERHRDLFSSESSMAVSSISSGINEVMPVEGLKVTTITSHSEVGAHAALKSEFRKVLEADSSSSEINHSAISDVSVNTNALVTAMIQDCVDDIKNETAMEEVVTEKAVKHCQLKAKLHRIIHASWNASSSEDADPPIMAVDLEAGEGPSSGPLNRRPKVCALCKGYHLGPKSKVRQGCQDQVAHGFDENGHCKCSSKNCVLCGN